MREVCDAGGAIFFSTHVLEVAEKLCDKVAIIKSGKLIRSGIMDDEIQVDYLEKTEEENSESSFILAGVELLDRRDHCEAPAAVLHTLVVPRGKESK